MLKKLPPTSSAMKPLSVFVPARFWMVAVLTPRQLTFTRAGTLTPPAVPSSCKVELPLLLLRIWIVVAFAKAAGCAARTAPSFDVVLPVSMFSVPDKKLVAPRISVPGPLLAKPFVPASEAVMVAVFATTAAGCVNEPVSSVRMLPPLEAIVQDWLPDVSPNLSVPMLRAESSATVRFAVMLMALKSAGKPGPLATNPLLHRFVSLQSLLASALQIPLTLTTGTAIVSQANALAPAASLTRTVKWFVPPSAAPGVPVRIPALLTVNQAGPPALPYVKVSPGSGSVAVPVMVLL